MVRIVALLGLHERLRFQVRRVRVFGRLGLHVLRGCVAAAGGLDHHAGVPEESVGFGEGEGGGEDVAGVVGGGVEEGWFGHCEGLGLVLVLFRGRKGL